MFFWDVGSKTEPATTEDSAADAAAAQPLQPAAATPSNTAGDFLTHFAVETQKNLDASLVSLDVEKMKTEFGRGINQITTANNDIGKLMFESAESAIQDAVIASNIETMTNIVKELTEFVLSGPFSIKVQGFLGANVVLVTSLLACIVNMLNANIFLGLVYIVMMVVSLIFAIYEFKAWVMPTRITNWIKEELRCIFKPYGRPIILHVFGIIIFSQADIVTKMGLEQMAAGSLIIIISFILFYNTWSVGHQLAAVKDLHINYAILSKKYNAADTMMKGRLNTKEFVVFLDSIDIHLGMGDLATVLEELDENHDGEVSWDEFINW